MHFYEKLTIMIVIFLGVTIGTASVIGTCVKIRNSKPVTENRIILEGASF